MCKDREQKKNVLHLCIKTRRTHLVNPYAVFRAMRNQCKPMVTLSTRSSKIIDHEITFKNISLSSAYMLITGSMLFSIPVAFFVSDFKRFSVQSCPFFVLQLANFSWLQFSNNQVSLINANMNEMTVSTPTSRMNLIMTGYNEHL